jgi:hypothetical protein
VLEKVQVHAEQHLRPVLRLGAAGAGLDCEVGVARVVGPVEQGLELDLLAALLQLGERAVGLGDRVGVAGLSPSWYIARTSSIARSSESTGSVTAFSTFISPTTDWAPSWSSQNPGSPILASSSFLRRSLAGTSKRVPDRNDPGRKAFN